MSTDRDTTRIVRSWLRTEEHESADRVLGAVLDRLDTTPQRRATWWPARRLTHMNSALRLGLVAAAVVVAIIGFSALSGNVGGPQPPTPEPSATIAPSPSPIPRLNGQQGLTGGRYLVEPVGNGRLGVSIEVPEGWNAFERWAVNPPIGADPPTGHAVGFWTVENLYVDPLDPEAGVLDPPVGPTVDDLVEAFVSHRGWTTSTPTPITIDGYSGQVLELTVPEDVEFANCRGEGDFQVWAAVGGGGRCAQGPGQIHQLSILDVDGARLVVAAIFFPETPAADRALVQGVVDSIRIETP